MKIDRRTFLAGTAATAGVAAVSGPQSAFAAADFSGQTVEWICPFSEGGGSSVLARYYQPYLKKYLPGNPDVVIRNIPGGGSITGTNEFAARARPDGKMIIVTSATTQFPYLLGDPRVRYDYKNFTPVLVSPTGGVCYLPPNLGVESAADLNKIKDQELIYGSQGPTSLDLVPMIAFLVLGLNVRYVFGMPGRADGRLAFERGETTIDYQTSGAYLSNVVPLVEAGKAVPIFSWGVLDANGEFARDPTFPDLPHFVEAYEMMHGKRPEGIEFDVYKAVFGSGFAAQKPVMLPKGTPQDIVDAYTKAFEDAVADPEFQAGKGEVLGEYEQATGDAALRLYDVATNMPDEARDWLRNYLTTEYNVRF
ncbi:Bug family tripartite tricarboxylate transporter substrate binding protein [Faunimonas sp. B44]|uniref:Bug family tripartite tricarboxylate transporter substrate binding protein n=1 Tax=Faunimonas sp. B44 TaxID=3461493 RepID=UPI004043CA4F